MLHNPHLLVMITLEIKDKLILEKETDSTIDKSFFKIIMKKFTWNTVLIHLQQAPKVMEKNLKIEYYLK